LFSGRRAEAAGPLTASQYLMAAAHGIASSRDVVIVFLRAEALTRPKAGRKPSALGVAFHQLIQDIASDPASKRGVRFLFQTYDAVAAVRAREAGFPVLSADGWSQDMAKAIFQPRYLPPENKVEWNAVWAAVGGHPSHLRQVAELLVEERKMLEMQARQEEMEELRKSMQREREQPYRNPDAESFVKISEEQIKDDSFRADARQPESAAEQLL